MKGLVLELFSDIKRRRSSYPAIFLQAAKHLQRERNGEGVCDCGACTTVRKVLGPVDFGKRPQGSES